ncbi:hypothetical protein CTAYLR_003197 [Chrysophaeum taylorii]|uniref:GST N-terminal domain-containing protein n=1 Tax=Chrysophaeum taylorii TaxID=2483200 RepID=A0AAD7UDS8_9STRA|nr:hypothetical protein CTAYLR_003197 [Chrysophaeum taylorii]
MASAAVMSLRELKSAVGGTAYGRAMEEEVALRKEGKGSPHRASKLRLFDVLEPPPRVTLYRDAAAWCPYCQKTWMLLEEKKIPYRVELVNMRSYGDKPREFLGKVPGGFLPAIDLDGSTYTESLDIMALLDRTFPETPMIPEDDVAEANRLLRLERELFGAWCSYVFRGDDGKLFDLALQTVEEAIKGPFFLGATLSIVDLQYVSHVERMAASVAYWKARDIRAEKPGIDAWLRAIEALDSYDATRSDYYTHVMNIPPQYGNPQKIRSSWQSRIVESTFPLKPDPLQPNWGHKEPTAALEALFHLVNNFDAVSKFASRPEGSGVGKWSFMRPDRARLADPYAAPAQDRADLDAVLLVAATILWQAADHDFGAYEPSPDLLLPLRGSFGGGGGGSPKNRRRDAVVRCCEYLRDRVGVPRDMSYPAARTLRASLSFIISNL